MKHVGHIAGREFRSIFSTPVAYVLFAAYLVLAGYIFFFSLGIFLQNVQWIQAHGRFELLEQFSLNEMVIGPALGTFSVILTFLIPLLTMRAFAEERSSATIELLLTSPLSIWEIVLGKYLAVLSIVVLLVGASAFFPALLFFYGDPEVWRTVAGLLGLLMYGAAMAAIGCFISSLTRSQIIAAIVSFVVGLLMLVIGAAGESTPAGPAQEALRYLAIQTHFSQALDGVIRTEDLVYFGALIIFALTLLRTSVESLRWR